ncbi:MAG TPA: alpha-glucuronidase [Candidatus Eisenbergiella merdavium]|uniref:Xylan alpha-1,2-glucuronidase n=1 Tax=Candidatus Eisenbergiella merdavium TaxID=2838551 RepID=A0A9D2NIX5_9FIRM|nr:alpha-glucuronidase [Candidatus Eisenbergiella merdavium]
MSWEHAWLNYEQIRREEDRGYFERVYVNVSDPVADTAVKELARAALELLGVRMEQGAARDAGIRLLQEMDETLGEEGYRIEEQDGRIVIRSGGGRGLLYGSFALIRCLQTGARLKGMYLEERPSCPLRMLNHWDNMDGSIERGYSGRSFFFADEKVIVNDRTREYARLAASVGINACVINNVNVKGNATRLITEEYVGQLRKMSDIFAEYGLRLFLSLNFAAPMELGGLDSADPLDERVADWWKRQMEELFIRLPDLGGFLVKADSEGRPGPFTYGRTHADGANMLADAAAPFGGLIIWRCFVYNCQQDWRDRKTDRARSGYDNFMSLDGSFRDNVILQIKNGPMDFQVREPVSPLLGGLEHTNQILEVQLAQEYTGQQRHLCYLLPMFRQVLDFHTCCAPQADTVADLVSGRTWGQSRCGIAAVANTGDDDNWTGHDLAAANLFGFGRLAFRTDADVETIAREWAACTFGCRQETVDTVVRMLMMSWPAYEKYTSPLGIGWMVNPGHHYGPNVDGYEYDRWGTYHRADHLGLGVDRSEKGTGYAKQYREPNASVYGNPETCPDELILFFHHLPYTWRLRSGKTVIQHIYDTHFEGAAEAEELFGMWKSLEGLVEPKAYERVLKRLEHQKEHAKEWRDQINAYFYRKSMIPDEQGRTIY